MNKFTTVLSMNDKHGNDYYGTNLIQVTVEYTLRKYPYSGVDTVHVYDTQGNIIQLESLNDFERQNIIDEAVADCKSKSTNFK